MKKFVQWIREDSLRDCVFVIGGACLVFGVGSIYRPAGYIVLGLLLMGMVLFTVSAGTRG